MRQYQYHRRPDTKLLQPPTAHLRQFLTAHTRHTAHSPDNYSAVPKLYQSSYSTHTHTARQSDRATERQSDRATERHTQDTHKTHTDTHLSQPSLSSTHPGSTSIQSRSPASV
eukprot:2513685-Rhodomonas_salina.1